MLLTNPQLQGTREFDVTFIYRWDCVQEGSTCFCWQTQADFPSASVCRGFREKGWVPFWPWICRKIRHTGISLLMVLVSNRCMHTLMNMPVPHMCMPLYWRDLENASALNIYVVQETDLPRRLLGLLLFSPWEIIMRNPRTATIKDTRKFFIFSSLRQVKVEDYP